MIQFIKFGCTSSTGQNILKFEFPFITSKIIPKMILAITLLLVTVSFATSDVYAHHLSQEMKWQMVYITHNNVCSNYDTQMTRTYSEIASSYIDRYQLQNSQYDTVCVNQYEYSGYSTPFDLDLIILVYDKDIGRSELHSQNVGGYYHHVGSDALQNHAIVVCDCPTFNYSSPIWILSHELSHFVLTYLGYDMTIIEDLVHTNDVKYDKCIQSHSTCGSAVMKIRSETSAYSYSVMPLYEPAIGASSIEITDEEIPIQVIELAKVLTKLWTEDRISDSELFNALGYMATGNTLYTHMNPQILTADTAFNYNEESWEKLVASKSGGTQDILSRIPKSMLSNDDLLLGEGKTSGIPPGFKTTAKWWVEGEISDDDFSRNVNFLTKEGLLRPR